MQCRLSDILQRKRENMIQCFMQNITIGDLTTGTNPLIAVPLTDREILSDNLPLDGADLIELRVDMFRDLSETYVRDIIGKAKSRLGKPIIVTIRSYDEGGAVELSDKERKSLFKSIIEHADAVDIEIDSEIFGSIVKLAHKKKKASIGSFHDFQKTPPYDDIAAIIKKARSFRADIAKIAVMPTGPDDLRTITDITLRHYDAGLITIAMGEIGMAARIFLPMIGSLMTFASYETPTAPGQLSLEAMQDFFYALRRDADSME